MANASLRALGTFVPSRKVDNAYFESIVETNSEWIVSRTGIQTRHFCEPNEYTSNMCQGAIEDLMRNYDGSLEDVDMIIVATVSPDQPMPGMACMMQDIFKLRKAGALDVSAACAGFVYGVILAKGLISSNSHRKILVVGAETLTKLTEYTDRTSCVLFGDGAGAVLIEADPVGNLGDCITGAAGDGGIDLYISGMAETLAGQQINRTGKIVQNGRKVFKWAVNTVSQEFYRLLEKNNMAADQLDWFVPHSANLRIIEAISSETGFPLERILESITDCGNTSSASIPLALHKGIRAGKVMPGDRIMLFGFGGGLTYAGIILRWE